MGLTVQADDFSHDGDRLTDLLFILLEERLEVPRSNQSEVAADNCGECRSGRERRKSLCVVLCCCPLQKARSKRSTSPTLTPMDLVGC